MDPANSDALRHQLRQARDDARLSRAELARRLGITETQVLRIENGTRSTSIQRAQAWLVACGFGVETIKVGEPDRASLLATALATLDEHDLEPLARVLLAWPHLPDHVRGAIASLIGPHVPK